METHRTRALVSKLLPLVALVALLTTHLIGCSSGGGGSASSGASLATAGAVSGATGQVTMVVRRDGAKQAGLIPIGTTTVRVSVIGTSIVTTVDFPPGASEVQVVLDGVPIGTRTLLVEALTGTTVVASGRIVVEVTTNTVVSGAVTLTPVSPTPTPTPSVSPSASPTPGSAKISFTIQPPPRVAAGFVFGNGNGGPATIEVSVYDASGNLDTATTAPVTIGLAANPSGAVLSSPRGLTVTPVNGKATFSTLSIPTPATGLTLIAKTATLSATSTPLDCVSSFLGFTSTVNTYQQANVVLTDDLNNSLQVAVLDANHNVIPYVSDTVTVSLTPNPGNASLTGGVHTIVNGIASFPDMTVSGVTAPAGLALAGGTQTVPPVSIDVAPQTTTGAVFVGAKELPPGTGKRIVMYDVRQLKPKYVDVGYAPKAMVVMGGNFLYVGGDDNKLHVLRTVDLSEVSAVPLNGTPEVIRQDPVNNKIYVAETTAANLDIVDTTNAPISYSVSQVSGLNSVHALGVSAGAFFLDIAQISTNPELESRPIANPASRTSYGSLFGSVTGAYLDFTPSGEVGLMTQGSAAAPASFNALRATSPFGSGGFTNPTQFRVDVRFYKSTTGATEDGTCLVANDFSGQIEVAYLKAVLPQPNPTPPTIVSVTTAADPRGLVNASGAEFITLAVGPDASTNVTAFVTDFSKSRLLLVDLTSATPQILSSVAMPAGTNPFSPTAITNHQLNVPSTH